MSPQIVHDPAAKREAILAAALELFAERGYHGTTVPEVAEKAGVGAGTLYRYFASKEALVNALYQQWKGEYGRALMTDLPVDRPMRQVFGALWSRMAGFARKHPKALKFLEFHHHLPYLDEKSRQIEEGILEPLLAFVVAAQEQHVLKPIPAQLLIGIVYGAFNGLLRVEDSGYMDLTPDRMRAAEQLIWEAIRA
jgi:AcrR family transcriptional regulator